MAHHPPSQSRTCLSNNERTILLPMRKTDSRDSNNISIDLLIEVTI